MSATTEALLALALALGLVAVPACGQPPQAVDEPESLGQALGSQRLGAGFVVWESARGGDWRIWTRRLDGSGLRQLTSDERASGAEGSATRRQGSEQHCCPHLSPSGRRLAYLSRAVPRERDARREVAGTLLLLDLDRDPVSPGDPPRVLSTAARTYGRGHRAVVWRNEHELIYLDAQGRTLLLDVERHLAGQPGAARVLVDQQDAELGWLIDPTLRYATTGVPSFSLFQPAAVGEDRSGRIAERRELGGCEPYFSADGRWGVWVHGAGGPLRAMRLDNRETTTLLRKNDSRLSEQGYTYFPMLSRDARLLAFAASPGGHDHYASNYDVFVAPVDPSTLQLLADPVRFTDHPGSDRYPDVYLQPPAAGESYAEVWSRPPPVVAAGESVDREPATDRWPADRRDLLFLWQTKDAPNLVQLTGPESAGLESSVNLEASGLARIDRQGRLQLDGGRFTAGPSWAEHVLTGARDRNELSVEMTFEPLEPSGSIETRSAGLQSVDATPTLLRLGRGGQTKLALYQRGRQLELQLQLGPDLETVPLVELTPGEVHHVAFTYTPGRPRVYLDGEPVLDSGQLQRDFFRWREPAERDGTPVPGWLELGPWSGSVEGIAVYGRLLDEAEVRTHASNYAQLRARRPEVEARRVVAELVAKSATPTLDEIAPYVDALAVYEYRVIRWLESGTGHGGADTGGDGAASATRDEQLLRVAHWVMLDKKELPITKSAPGSEVELTLEPYAAQPQLPEHVLSETLEPRYDLDLWFALRPFP